jgi:hypothetical protein
MRDSGVVELNRAEDAKGFLTACRQLRLWEREAKVKRI